MQTSVDKQPSNWLNLMLSAWPCLHSVFDHQIMLKGLAFVGGLPEHVVKQAHLEVRTMHCWHAHWCYLELLPQSITWHKPHAWLCLPESRCREALTKPDIFNIVDHITCLNT